MEAKLSNISDNTGPAESTDSELTVIASKYESFLRECNAVDIADVFKAVKTACLDAGELSEINRTSFLIVNPQFHCQIEVGLHMCILFFCSYTPI